ncbi:MAG: FAD-binding oxidoreductase [Alphaproteobacteria bacterium]|nr:FAD-binding oxidoreductase [Alphaproteobacteria bacterium]
MQLKFRFHAIRNSGSVGQRLGNEFQESRVTTVQNRRIVDIAVIGGGIAGASVAAELAKHARVVLFEMESQPGYHTTGRSAAMFAPNYGPAPIRALTRASAAYYAVPPEGFTNVPLLTRRDVLLVARADQLDALDALMEEVGQDPNTARIDGAAVREAQPLLREGYGVAGMLDQGGSDIDVAALHAGYLRAFKALGGEVLTNARVVSLERNGANWQLETAQGQIDAPIVVNAAGAWADEVAALAGVGQIGLVPKRRTALMVAAPEGSDPRGPLTGDIGEKFYLKPDGARLLISPEDEIPSPACDAQPDEMDIAICIDQIETAFDLSVRRIESKWAGLRSFVADGVPVAGYAAESEGFYWLAGQGGYGIQTAPALSRYAAADILGQELPQDILDQGLDPADLGPARLLPTG